MDKILIIEDSKDINHMLAEALTDAGYRVQSVYTGADGMLELQRGDYHLVVLDIMLPFVNGDELLKDMRSFSDAPVLVISARDRVDSKIQLLRMGADDYITKPFDLGEVAARVESLLRRSKRSPESSTLLGYKDMTLDDTGKRVWIRGEELELTAKEYGILELLLKHQGKVFTKANLYESIWQDAESGDDNAIKTHMSNLRSKLKKASPDEEYIETVWGLGYRLLKD